jgi:hypothetical protein
MLLASMSLSLPVAALEAPLGIRNIAPAAQLYGVPRAHGAALLGAGYELTFTTEIANNWTSDSDRDSVAFFDGETTVLSYGYRRGFAERWEFAVEVPYLIHHGGYLDRSIDGFHDVFGFDDDGRNRAGRGRIDYYIADRGVIAVNFQHDRRGWGDVRAQLGYQIYREADSALAARVMVKMPTGDADQLTGSGAADVAAWLEYGRDRLFGIERASLNAGLGAIALGDGDLLRKAQDDVVSYAHFGLGWRFTERLVGLGQLDYHSRMLDTGLTQVADWGLQGTLGLRLHFNDAIFGEFAFVEDLKSDSTSDVLFQFVLGARL